MSLLEDLKKKLYKQKEDESRLDQAVKPWLAQKPSQALEKPKLEAPLKIKKPRPKRKYFILMGISGFLLLVLIALSAILYLKDRAQFDEAKISLQIETPDKITSGDEVLYRVLYNNNSQIAIKNIELTFYFPQGSIIKQGSSIQSINVADLAPGENGSTEFRAILVGDKGDQKQARAVLSFQPANISSRFQKETETSIEIFHQPLILDIELPERISNNQPFNFSIECLNTSEVDFPDLAIKLFVPSTLEILSSQPQPKEGEINLWPMSFFAGGDRIKINLQAKVEEEEGELISFRAQVGRWQDELFETYSEVLEKTQITKPALFISQTISGEKEYIASKGQILTFKVEYQNTTDIAIPQVLIKAELEGAAFDFDTVNAPKSFFDRASQTITWNWRSHDGLILLGASTGGSLEFSIKLKSELPVRNFSDQNFTVSSIVTSDSENVPFDLQGLPIRGQDQTEVKIRSKITLAAKGYYRNSPISNTGPIPPKVGQKTTYTIVWQLMNEANDIENLEVRAKLPGHVTWENKIAPADENITYSQLTGEVIWQIDKLLANTGTLRPVKQVAFQISITPADNHVGQTLMLIGQSQAKGLDSFCQEEVSDQDGSISTNLPDDFIGQPGQGIVTQ